MPRYCITLSYDGTEYSGWQIQPNAVTVQETLQEAMSTIARVPMEVVGAGRTDAGVHAEKMVAHFDFEGELPFDAFKLNRLLPRDIAVQSIHEVDPDFHARFDATKRTYHYDISLIKDPFHRRFTTYLNVSTPLNFDKMNEAARLLLGEKDFTSFSKLHSDNKTNICRIYEAKWIHLEGERYRFVISADRFLRGMVRAVVGTLIEVGRGKMLPTDITTILNAYDRSEAGMSAPPEGLSLVEIEYE